MISDAVMDRIREATDVVELISAYVPLKKRGQNHVGLCPFHTEKTPSFSVNRERGIYHCFGCGRGGDVFRFLMEHERMGFLEAVSYLAERAHVDLPREDETRRESGSRLQAALFHASLYFEKALAHGPTGARAREYLQKRRVESKWVESFGIGYAPDRSRGLITFARRYDITLADLEAAGLVVPGQGRTGDRFRDRLMFPVRTVSGKPVAFGGRDLSGRSQAKYMNSPETVLYQKGRVLYGLYEARAHLQNTGKAILCEGYFDLIRLHEYGFGHSVAVSGTALSTDQARLLARYAGSVWLLFDADGAGQQAALRSVPVLFEAGLDVRIASLPGGQDPDLFLLEHGADALAKRLESAPDYVEYLEAQAGAPFARLSAAAQHRFLQAVVETAARVTDPIRRDLLIQSAWSRAGIPEQHIRERLSQAGTPVGSGPSRSQEVRDWREELLCLLVARPELRSRAREHISPEDFESELQRQLVSTLLADDYHEDTPTQLAGRPLADPLKSEISRLAALPLEVDQIQAEPAFLAYLVKARRQRLKLLARRLVSEMGAAERRGDKVEAAKLSARHMAVQSEWIKLGKGRAGGEEAE